MIKAPITILMLVACVVLLSKPLQAASYLLLTSAQSPYVFNQGGQTTGATVEIVTQVFRRAGLDFSVAIYPWRRAYAITQQQDNTCIFPIQRSQEREVQFRWVSPVAITHTGFYTLLDPALELGALDDVKGLIIGALNGSAAAEYLLAQGYDVKLTNTEAPNIQKLLNRRIQVWAADTLTATYMLKKLNTSSIRQQLVYFTTLRGLACNLNVPKQIIDRLAMELRAMYRDGSIEAIMGQYR